MRSLIRRRGPAPVLSAVLVSAVLAAIARSLPAAPACLDCHGGQDAKAPRVAPAEGSAHRDQSCGDCHSGAEQVPHPRPLAPVECASCHEDEANSVKKSSHAKALAAEVTRAAPGGGPLRPATACLACHGGDAHAVQAHDRPGAPTHRASVAGLCRDCHRRTAAAGTPRRVAGEKYLASVHGQAAAAGNLKAAVCTDCHGAHAIEPSSHPASSVHASKIAKTCGRCHEKARDDYLASAHQQGVAKGVRSAPLCVDCHGEHEIRSSRDPASPSWSGNVSRTCSACHASERITSRLGLPADRVTTYQDSFHGLSGQLGDLRAANCSSCHGHHRILPSSDPESSIHPKNLGRTCGQCHPGAERRFMSEKVHFAAKRAAHWLTELVRSFYLWLIPLTLGGMLLHNLLDLLCKTCRGPIAHRAVELTPIFTRNERLQHAVLVLSFVALAVSGFALEYPDSAFAWPFRWLKEAGELRKDVHRVAALVFALLGVYHVIYLFATERGREQRRAIRPRLRDVTDPFRVLWACVFGRALPLELPHYSYVEKFEYLALVWGSIVMTVTGLVLFFVSRALAVIPVWGVDLVLTVHFLEAILACLAILFWHGYWVIFDPDVYPLSPRMITGEARLRARGPAHEK